MLHLSQLCNWVTTADLDVTRINKIEAHQPLHLVAKPTMIQAIDVAKCSSKAAKLISIHVYATL